MDFSTQYCGYKDRKLQGSVNFHKAEILFIYLFQLDEFHL